VENAADALASLAKIGINSSLRSFLTMAAPLWACARKLWEKDSRDELNRIG
jgi:hypothetical protein